MRIKKIVCFLFLLLAFKCFDLNDLNPFKTLKSPNWIDLIAYFVNIGSFFLPMPKPDEMPYFNFFPRYDFNIIPNDSNKKVIGICYDFVSLDSEIIDNKVVLKILGLNKKSFFCTETLVVATLTEFHVVTLTTVWETTV